MRPEFPSAKLLAPPQPAETQAQVHEPTKKRGRPVIGDRPLTKAEMQARWRAKKRGV